MPIGLIRNPRRQPNRFAAAQELFEAGDNRSARKILEFVFAREIDGHQLVAANFLGLAEVRIAAGDTAAAIIFFTGSSWSWAIRTKTWIRPQRY